MTYRTCVGCIRQHEKCAAREVVRAQLKGLGVTSIKWKCQQRAPRFKIGDPVWMTTTVGYDQMGANVATFPGHIVRDCGSRMLVYVEPGAKSDCEDYEFEPRNRGFCKIPLARIEEREGPSVTICDTCELPTFKGHAEGYSCHYRHELELGNIEAPF